MRLLGIDPGPRECHDGQPQRLDVDFVYPQAKPTPIALEVTSLRDPPYMAGVPAAMAVQRRLSQMAERETLGSWIAWVIAVRDMRELEPRILQLVREQRPIQAGHYTVEDLLSYESEEERRAFMQMHDDLKELGLFELHRWPSKRENVVWVLPMSGARMVQGFTEALQECVEENAAKFRGIEDLRGHLAVLVGRFDFSGDPQETAVPKIPPQLERIWVVTDYDTVAGQTVWSAGQGEVTWASYDA